MAVKPPPLPCPKLWQKCNYWWHQLNWPSGKGLECWADGPRFKSTSVHLSFQRWWITDTVLTPEDGMPLPKRQGNWKWPRTQFISWKKGFATSKKKGGMQGFVTLPLQVRKQAQQTWGMESDCTEQVNTDINSKMAHITDCLNALPFWWWQCSVRHEFPLPTPPRILSSSSTSVSTCPLQAFI